MTDQLITEELQARSFRLHADYEGYTKGSPNSRQRTTQPREEAIPGMLTADVGDLVISGHGFTVETLGSVRPKPDPCPYCGGSRYSVNSWLCEFEPEAVTPMTDNGCECNWCLINRWAAPGKGRPRAHCGKPPCARADRRLRNRRNYEQRKASAA